MIDWSKYPSQFKNADCIPEMPVLPIEELAKDYWPEYYKRGAIPKKDLIEGHVYYGTCRNSDTATWYGDEFEFERYKFGTTFIDHVNHFEDDDGNGWDVFIPIKDITDFKK